MRKLYETDIPDTRSTIKPVLNKDGYYDGYIKLNSSGKTITDEDVARFAKKHMRWFDRLDFRKVTECVLQSQNILMGTFDHYAFVSEKEQSLITPNPNWKFYKGVKREKK